MLIQAFSLPKLRLNAHSKINQFLFFTIKLLIPKAIGIKSTLTVVKANPKPATELGSLCQAMKCKLIPNTTSKQT